jgi:hypothetical protein
MAVQRGRSELSLCKGWDGMIPTARDVLTRPPTDTPRRAGGWARAFRFPNFPRGSRQIVLHCAHRATTALSWELYEQENDLSTPSHPSEAARCASTGVVPPTPSPFSILLEFLHDPFGIAGQFHVPLSMNWFSLCGAGCLDGAFPIGDLRAAFGGEFLISHAGSDV